LEKGGHEIGLLAWNCLESHLWSRDGLFIHRRGWHQWDAGQFIGILAILFIHHGRNPSGVNPYIS